MPPPTPQRVRASPRRRRASTAPCAATRCSATSRRRASAGEPPDGSSQRPAEAAQDECANGRALRNVGVANPWYATPRSALLGEGYGVYSLITLQVGLVALWNPIGRYGPAR